jgi:glycosyltransferase involved in cell wall biosynthesis
MDHLSLSVQRMYPALRDAARLRNVATKKIAAAVSGILWADEMLVANSGSSDRTAEIAEGLGARVIQVPFQGFGDLRNRAIAECKYEWLFNLDSDERHTPKCATKSTPS